MQIATALLLCMLALPQLLYADALDTFYKLDNAGLIVQKFDGESLVSSREREPFIPASTTKLVTAWLALNHWGKNKRFATDFHYNKQTFNLVVKGYGDPYLVSEEIARMAGFLKSKGVTRVDKITLDSSAFADKLALPGAGTTDNPYDAIATAIAANFNTLYIKRTGSTIQSAEKQTPLTDFARRRADAVSGDVFRINTGTSSRDSERYFAEILLAFLERQGVKVKADITFGKASQKAAFYRYHNSRTLAEIIRPMLEYSNNFIANQLILMLASEYYARPATAPDVQRYMQDTLSQAFGWKHFTLQEGAGLSRNNRLSPVQLTQLLTGFYPWKHLLPEIDRDIFAKSGTLHHVSTLAGYIVLKDRWLPFAVMINQPVPYKLRNQIATQLKEQIE